MSNSTAEALFTRDSSGYNDLRRKLVPCFDDFYGAALRLIDLWKTTDKFKVLDLGAGTGLFASLVAEYHPQAQLCLIDVSSGMLEKAQKRFASHEKVEFRLGDLTNADLGDGWNLIISALAIHHLSDDQKQELYRRIFQALVPGGMFINAEQVAGPTPLLEERYEGVWLKEIRRLGVPDPEIAKAQERMLLDKCTPLDQQLSWLKALGFSEVDCSFKAWRFAVFSGVKT